MEDKCHDETVSFENAATLLQLVPFSLCSLAVHRTADSMETKI